MKRWSSEKLNNLPNSMQYMESLRFELRSSEPQSLCPELVHKVRIYVEGEVMVRIRQISIFRLWGRQDGNNLHRGREAGSGLLDPQKVRGLELDRLARDKLWRHETQAGEPDPLKQEGQTAHSPKRSPYTPEKPMHLRLKTSVDSFSFLLLSFRVWFSLFSSQLNSH